jgi:hypothetical protein
MFFSFPEDARWNPDRQAVEFGVSIGEYEGVVRVPRAVFRRFIDGSVTPERCIEAYHLQRTRFELITERKLRRRQLTDDANIEITGRNLREREVAAGDERAHLSGFRRRSNRHLNYRSDETRLRER